MLWVADITHLRTWEGRLYLAAVQDAYSRRIVGWSMADHMRAELVVDALQMALDRRRAAPGLIHHSDQGSPEGVVGEFEDVGGTAPPGRFDAACSERHCLLVVGESLGLERLLIERIDALLADGRAVAAVVLAKF